MKVPIRIYYDVETGIVIQFTGNFEDKGLKQYDSIEKQILKYKSLSDRIRETFDVIELPFGSHRQDFLECNGYRVNPETKELEFSYPDPNEPNVPPMFQKPLSVEVEELWKENADLWFEKFMVDMELIDTKQKVTQTEREIADLWFEILVGGM